MCCLTLNTKENKSTAIVSQWSSPQFRKLSEYTASELIDIVSKFKQKARERIPAWLVQLRDVVSYGISLTRQKTRKMSNINIHPALQQGLHGAEGDKVTHYSIDWIILACRVAWLNKGDLPRHVGH